MRIQLPIASCVLCLAGGVALAQDTLSTIEVNAEDESVTVSCHRPEAVTPEDVQRVLSIEDPAITSHMRRKFIGVVSEACQAGIPRILVTRGGNESLTWKPLE